ncbi:phosphoribosyl-ATP diphosphatase [Cardiobacterium valvarum]|uniref:phosphoribosyl-ATP diphosphatase n=1 Tax=Cardiobacterium valvarum TaxID=194702 RepID=UPI0035E78B9D
MLRRCSVKIYLAEPQGPTCHTGATSCFHVYDREPPPGWPWFTQLADELAARKNADPATSYTAHLHARDLTKIAQKVGEEGVETALAAVSGDDNGLADLLYHLTVLMHARGLD